MGGAFSFCVGTHPAMWINPPAPLAPPFLSLLRERNGRAPVKERTLSARKCSKPTYRSREQVTAARDASSIIRRAQPHLPLPLMGAKSDFLPGRAREGKNGGYTITA